MALTVRVTQDRSFSRTVHLGGRLDNESAPALERELDTLAGAALDVLVFDLEQLEYISSAGLRVLLLAAKRLKPPQGALVLCGLGPSVRTVLELAGFMSLFVVEPGREQALALASGASAP